MKESFQFEVFSLKFSVFSGRGKDALGASTRLELKSPGRILGLKTEN
jgi:hypothetical protein